MLHNKRIVCEGANADILLGRPSVLFSHCCKTNNEFLNKAHASAGFSRLSQ